MAVGAVDEKKLHLSFLHTFVTFIWGGGEYISGTSGANAVSSAPRREHVCALSEWSGSKRILFTYINERWINEWWLRLKLMRAKLNEVFESAAKFLFFFNFQIWHKNPILDTQKLVFERLCVKSLPQNNKTHATVMQEIIKNVVSNSSNTQTHSLAYMYT